MKLPTLYKKTSTDAIQYWKIYVLETPNSGAFYNIYTEYGQVGTANPQQTADMITKGKNVGKKNETSALQQAEAEAKAKHEKQLKKGYVTSIESAEAGELNSVIEGGIVPMLAHKFSEQAHKIKYPAFVQPKLDGIRCIAILDNGKCTLWSRTRKPITSMPHIITEIEGIFGKSPKILIFDGELYNHEFKKDFEKIVSAVRKENPEDGYLDVQYHIYDVVKDIQFKDRARMLNIFRPAPYNYLRFVDTVEIKEEDQVAKYFEKYKEEGYEGCMVRNAESMYVNKRSYDLLKVKEFDDGEFDILGVEEGRGKLQGHAGAFLCRTSDGKTFLAKMSGDTAKLRDYFLDHKLWEGKRLTVQYQGLTGKEGVPRFPVGIAIRDYE